MNDVVVWLDEERTFGRLMTMGTYFSMVSYTQAGIDYEVLIENNEYTILEGGEDGTEDENRPHLYSVPQAQGEPETP